MVNRICSVTIFVLLFSIVVSCQKEVNFPNGSINSIGPVNGSFFFSSIPTFLNGGLAVEQITGYAEDSTEGFLGNPLPISSSKTLLSTKNGKILQTTFATVDWEYTLKDSAYVITSMAVDPTGNIYAISSKNKLLSLTKDGDFRFEVPLFSPKRYEHFHGLLATETGLVLQNSHGYTSMISFDGKKIWEQHDTTIRTPYQAFIENDILVKFAAPNDEMQSSFVELWSLKKNTTVGRITIPKSFEVVNSPVYYKESLLFIGKEFGNTVCKRITLTNTLQWENTSLPMYPKSISVSDSGKIIISLYEPGVADYRSCIVSMNENGVIEWKKYFDNRISSAVYVCQNDLMFLGTSQYNSGLYFLHSSGKYRGSVMIPQEIIPHLKLGITPNGEITLGTQKTLRLIRTRK